MASKALTPRGGAASARPQGLGALRRVVAPLLFADRALLLEFIPRLVWLNRATTGAMGGGIER